MRAQKKLYIVTDLGPGDGGKGGVVHKISHLRNAHTILKVGGAQGSHGVSTSGGDRFAFSQFGCGTFEGGRTHLSRRFVVSPEGLLNEAQALRYDCGLGDVFNLLTVDWNALCATPYHGIASRIREMARGHNPRGTIGTGVGEAYRDAQRHPELAIRAGDLVGNDVRDRLAAVCERTSADLAPLIEAGFLPEDQETAQRDIELLRDPGFLTYVVRRFSEVAQRTTVVGAEYLGTVLAREGVTVVESSHGVLTDRYQGFHPHTSAIRTLPRFTRDMLRGAGYDGDTVSIGVTRAYQIRHGAGPMPTADEAMAENLLPGSHKDENRFQGKVRVGPMDLVLLRYAIEACGPQAFDGLAITWFDQVQRNGRWQVCNQYRGVTDPTFFDSPERIKVRVGDDEAQLVHQERLGILLRTCSSELTEFSVVPDAGRGDLYDLCAGVLHEQLNVPVRMVSFGPTERDKECR
jgi:adenylosuccinate synthase